MFPKPVMKQFSFLFLILISFNVDAQVSQEEFNQLKSLVLSLQQEKDSINSQLYQVKKKEFFDMKYQIENAYDKTDVIEQAGIYQSTISSVIQLHQKITTVNNFGQAKEVFGIDFISFLETQAEKDLVQTIQPLNESPQQIQKKKSFLRNLIGGIIRSPIIEGIVKSNPITSVVYSLVNQMMSSKETQFENIQIDRGEYQLPEQWKDLRKTTEYEKFKENYYKVSLGGTPKTNNLVSQKSIKNFENNVLPYVKLFDELSSINQKYQSTLQVFQIANNKTIEQSSHVLPDFLKILNVETRADAKVKIDDFFEVGKNPTTKELNDKFNSNEIITMTELLKYSTKVEETSIALNNDFKRLVSIEIELCNDYIQFFESVKDGKSGLPEFNDLSKVNQNISEFESLKMQLDLILKKL